MTREIQELKLSKVAPREQPARAVVAEPPPPPALETAARSVVGAEPLTPAQVVALQRCAGNGRVAQLLRHTGQAAPTGPRRPGLSPPRRSLQRILDDNGTKLGPEDDTDLVNGLASNLEKESPALARQFREAVRNPQDLGAFDAWLKGRRERWWFEMSLGSTLDVSQTITQAPNYVIEHIIEKMEENDLAWQEELQLAREQLRKRVAALDLVTDFAADDQVPPVSPKFTQIDKVSVATHLKATIEQPSLINQRSMEWCGPNTFMMIIARNDPVGYAQYVIDMYSLGKATLGRGQKVKPTKAVKEHFVPGTAAHPDIEAADWLALGSLRDSSNAFMSATTMPVGSATFPAHIIDWFHNYGVPKSQIVERGGFVAKTRASALQEATSLFGARMNVLLWVHKSALTSASPPGNLAKKLKDEVGTFDLAQTHWVVMDGPFTYDPAAKLWSCPVNTWGAKAQHKLWVSEKIISSTVFGFVAVDMTANVKAPKSKAL